MKRMFALVLALVMVISLMPGIFVTAQNTDRVTDLVNGMSLRDKVTQMMMVDFRDWASKDFTVMNDEVRQIIEDYNFGSIILFADNIKETEQSYNLTTAMQAAATKDGGIALLIAADQEGGTVYRLGSGTALPGNMALGATYTNSGTVHAYNAGKIIGSELGVLGINTNLAPVVDVNNNANNPVIGLRSFGDDATMVGELASAVIAGLAEYNVIGTAKHFPGHGDTATDSHYGLPIVDKSLDVLMENELKPYTVAIDQGIEMIMTAHILYPQLESDKILSNKTGKEESLPATMSDDILTKLLKEQMGFDGIVVTDAMNMAGISGCWDQVQSCVIAIQAGVDMICMPTTLNSTADLKNLDAIINGIIAAVEDGTIPMERINDAVKRILTVKENRGILDYDPADYSLEQALAVVGSDENRAMERDMAAAAVTVVRDEQGVLPLQITENTKVLMLVPYNNERAQMLMGWNRAREAGLIPEGAEVDYFRFSSATITSELRAKLDWADVYIIHSEIGNTSRLAYNHWLSSMPNKLCDYAAENGKISIISSVDKPYDVQLYPNATALVATYGCKGSTMDPTEALIGGATGDVSASGPNITAAIEVIFGVYEAKGTLPVDIPLFSDGSFTDEIVYQRGHGLTYAAAEPAVLASGWSGYTTWELFENGTLVVSPTEERWNGKCNMKNYWKVGGKLSLPWSDYAEEITTVVIKNGVNAIGQMAFYELPNLKSVYLGRDVEEIRNYAFKNCRSLESVSVNAKLYYIREGAFYGDSALTAFNFPESFEAEEWAFTHTNIKPPLYKGGKMDAPSMYSETMKFDWNYTVYTPASYDAKKTDQAFPVVYLLHGAWGNHRNMVELCYAQDKIDTLIRDYQLQECVVVFVDGFNSFYVDGPALDMETALINDLIPFIEEKYHGMGTKEGRAIGGLSMGGYGAARFCLKYPEMFNACLMYSPAVWTTIEEGNVCAGWCLFDGFDQESWNAEHPLAYLESYKAKNSPVNFYINHGDSDIVVPMEPVQHFVDTMRAAGSNVVFEIQSGKGHAWSAWRVAMEKSLAFYGSLLGGTSYAAYSEANSAAIEAASETFELKLEAEAAETNAAYKGTTTSPDLYSPALKLDWNYTAYLPASYDEDNTNQAYPVIYLLHGAYGNHTNMQERFSTSDIMNELIGAGKMPEAIVVFVDGFNSYYVDGPAFAMETALIEDLIPFIEEKYHGMGTKEGRIIGGISMGGYGAARYAMKYPEYFSAALLLSPAVWENATGTGSVSGWHIFVDENNQFSQEAWAANHPLVYKDSYIEANSPVNFYIVHGDKDTTVLPAAVSAFYEELNEFAPATYVNYAGGTHAWTTWAATARMALEYAGSLLLHAAE